MKSEGWLGTHHQIDQFCQAKNMKEWIQLDKNPLPPSSGIWTWSLTFVQQTVSQLILFPMPEYSEPTTKLIYQKGERHGSTLKPYQTFSAMVKWHSNIKLLMILQMKMHSLFTFQTKKLNLPRPIKVCLYLIPRLRNFETFNL